MCPGCRAAPPDAAPPDRRAFLRGVGVALLGSLALPALACGRDVDVPPDEAGPERARGATLTRPLVLPWGEDAVLVAAPLRERPAAYVSRALQRVYVDHDLRDRVTLALGAHISVSTGLWRIPLPGDPLRMPIPPGDRAREFEEQPISAWDPSSAPAEGDMRLSSGRPESVTLELRCAPISTTRAWCSGGPWRLWRCGPVGPELCREVLAEVGRAVRHADRTCAGPGAPARCLTWTAPGP